MQERSSSEDYAIILAGGLSSRMGQDKSLLSFGGETMLERVYAAVAPLVEKAVIMLSQVQDGSEITRNLSGNFSIGLDSTPQQGPLQGISDAVSLLPDSGRFIYILSCDLPYLTTDWLSSLKSALLSNEQAEIACTSQEGHHNPLIAIYRFAVVEQSKALVASGKRSCLALLDPHLVLSREPLSTERWVTANVNTPEEYHQLLNKTSLS